MATPEEIARRLAARADRAAAAFARDLGRVWRAAERHIQRLLTDGTPSTDTGLLRVVQAASLRQQMRVALRQAGYDALVESATDAPLTAIAKTWILARPALARLVTAPQIEALRAVHQMDLLEEGDRVASALWDAAYRGLFIRRQIVDILDDLSAVIDRHDAQIVTLYDTTVSIFTRQLELIDAGDDPGAQYLYTGPDDAKTRPFCEARVNQVFTRREIEAMDNGQIDNVLLSGGGYNCRHLWMRVSARAQ